MVDLTNSNPHSHRSSSLRGFLVLLDLISLTYIRRHPGRLLVVLLSVSLGVAAIVASGNLIRSAIVSTRSAWQVNADQADFHVANGFGGVPNELLEGLRSVQGVVAASAILARSAQLHLGSGTINIQILAFDLLGDDPIHRSNLGADEIEVRNESDFITKLNAILLERNFAEAHGFSIGSTLESEVQSGRQDLYVAGFMEPSPATASFGGAVAVMDLFSAQVFFGREGLVDAIDVRVMPTADVTAVENRLRAVVKDQATLTLSGGDSGELASLVSNLRLILGVPGVMAIVVGALVIYHTVSIAVSHRKPQLDVVRSLGISRKSLLALFAVEGLVVGVLGSGLGILMGFFAAGLASGIVRDTISSLYRPLAVSQLEISWSYLAIGLALGVGITMYAFVAPARSSIGNLVGLSVASASHRRWSDALRGARVGAALIPIGLFAGWLQNRGFAGEQLAAVATSGDALILLGSGLLIPTVLLGFSARTNVRLPRRLVLMRLGWLGLTSDPARTGVVITAVLVGSAYVMITVGPIGSLRHTVVNWMDRTQNADLVVAASGSIGFFPNSMSLPPQLWEILKEEPAVASVEPTSLVTQPFEDRWVVLVARRPAALGTRFPLEVISGDFRRGQESMEAGDGTIVSRHFAVQHGLEVGNTLVLRSPTGPVSLRVDAVVTDFSSADLGTIFVTPEFLKLRWREEGVSTYHLWLNGSSPEDVREKVISVLRPYCNCTVLTREELRLRITEVLDSMFYMAYALEVIAAIVMVVAVLSFFSITLDERQVQIDLMRTLGATRWQVTGSLIWEAVWIGILGSTIGSAVGGLLAWRMTETTIKAGGGFELDFVLPPDIVALTIGGAVAICVLSVLLQRGVGSASQAEISLQ